MPSEMSVCLDEQLKVYDVGSNRKQVLCTHTKELLIFPNKQETKKKIKYMYKYEVIEKLKEKNELLE